ncbi:type II toxin-antitoxin system RelE/ParE family toxin [Candidatus Pacearchaeota archaeon]|nr:type II toxin-antitoxin system RelE/ParE family toxin [Candidatus Pacearchaeota archaeon]
MVHPRVRKFIDESGEKEKIKKHLKKLSSDPYHSKSKVDIKKLKGRKHDMYRLRLGDYRFEYFIDEEKIWIDNAFKRERGYR